MNDLIPGKWYRVNSSLHWVTEIFGYKEPTYPRATQSSIAELVHSPLCTIPNGGLFLFFENKVVETGFECGIWSYISFQDVFAWADFEYIGSVSFEEVTDNE